MSSKFQEQLDKAAALHGVDVRKIRADEKLMMVCIDLYYNGALDGTKRLSERLKEKTIENVAFPTLSTPTVS